MLALCALVATTLGCDSDDEPPPPASVPDEVPRGAPDDTEPGELAEGDELAFGLPVPRDMRIEARFPDAIYARGRVGFEAAANYVRKRVATKHIETGPAKTVFEEAALVADPKKRVRVEVSTSAGVVEIVVRDRTRLPAEPGLTPEERWRRADPSNQ